MRTVQIAAECYYTDLGRYPAKLDVVFQSYFPGGQVKTKAGKPPENPYDTKATWPIVVPAGSKMTAQQIVPGSIIYTCAANCKTYSIFGIDQDGKYLIDDATGKTMKFSN